MNAHDPDSAPLDPRERELARVLRALPAGEPSPALDARVLKAAADATAATRVRRVGWLGTTGPLWSIGSAAAAVIAIGIAWRAFEPPQRLLPPTSPAPVSAPLDHGAPTTVEFRDLPAASGPAAPPPAESSRRQTMPAPALPSQPLPAPSAKTRPMLDEAVPHAPTPLPEATALNAQGARPEATAAAEAAGAPVPRATGLAKSADSAEAADRASVAGVEGDPAALERVRADARRYPEAWLLKIRARRDQGDLAGARASLHLFQRRYPGYPLPDDLRSLAAP